MCHVTGGHAKTVSETSRQTSHSSSEKYTRVRCAPIHCQRSGRHRSQIVVNFSVNILIKAESVETHGDHVLFST